ncbi:MAG: NAD-dependent epimerase/dehydratase family protein [Candidatus Bathyarchaeota archaeon BA1]|nr:MAG: NAD-dependent epimerase/dehydratase family protein [Candidatus Bathyarchaeota archaeon BA1]
MIFNSYGPRLRADGDLWQGDFTFYNSRVGEPADNRVSAGTQTRSFCYITDTCIGLLLLSTDEGARGEVVNVGNAEEVTILELAGKIKQLIGSTSPLTFHPLPEGDPRRRCSDISRAETVLGWKPKTSLEQGLTRTITWFQSKRAWS